MTNISGKVVVITGAASGIGRALAVRAAQRGAKLAISDVDEIGLTETAKLCGSAPVMHDVIDVRDVDAIADWAASINEEYGCINVIINNAGVALTGNVEAMTYEEMRWVLDIDYWGVVYGTKEFLPYLIESGDGHVVNISSLFGLLSVPGQSAYNSAKFAVRGFTEALRQEMIIAGHPVEVTCVHPGGIKTGIARNSRASDGEDQQALANLFDKKLAKTTADQAAKVILDGVGRNRPRVLVGLDAKLLHLIVKVGGAHYQRLFANVYGRVAPKAKTPTVASTKAKGTSVK